MLHNNRYKYAARNVRGFTIIELLVTLGIVVLVTGVVMIRYSSFNSSVLLTSQAYTIGFDLRETQSLAVSVRGNSSQFREEYGMYFDMTSPDEYILFQDDDTNGDQSPARYHTNEAVGVPNNVDSRFTIVDICGTNSSSRTCYSDDATFSNIAVSFKRPDFDAALYSPVKSNLQSVEIIIGSEGSSQTKSVIVYASGQIAID